MEVASARRTRSDRPLLDLDDEQHVQPGQTYGLDGVEPRYTASKSPTAPCRISSMTSDIRARGLQDLVRSPQLGVLRQQPAVLLENCLAMIISS